MRPRAWALLLALLALPALALACPTCKDALKDNPEAEGFARGVYLSILFMLGMVFSLAGLLIYKVVRAAREEAPKEAAAPKA